MRWRRRRLRLAVAPACAVKWLVGGWVSGRARARPTHSPSRPPTGGGKRARAMCTVEMHTAARPQPPRARPPLLAGFTRSRLKLRCACRTRAGGRGTGCKK